ncbi:MAG: radical SAM protein [Oscillospiraceae bacterium]|nr:radical SAM protein [Oscillospiraceae bacterium]
MSPKRRIIPVFVPHVGCPNNCVFCDQKKISGALSPASAEDVSRAIENAAAVIPEGETAELAFYGGSFTAIPPAEQEALLAAARKYDIVGPVRVSTRPDRVDGDALSLLKAYGVETVELGAQSMDDEVLRLSGRDHKASDTVRAAELVKASGMKLILQMMTGLPGDTAEKTLATARKIASLSPDGVRIYPTVIIKGTPLEDMWRAGLYKEHTVSEAVEWCVPVVQTFWDAKIDIIRLGLNPTDDLSAGTAVAGAYHPALGTLVYSRLYLELARGLLAGAGKLERATLGVAPRAISYMAGLRRENTLALEKEFAPVKIKIVPAKVGMGTVKPIDFPKKQ